MKTIIYFLAFSVWVATGCSEGEHPIQNPEKKQVTKDLVNINILIDLSDRIKVNSERDQELIRYVAEYFRKHIESKKLFFIKDEIKVFFYPEPQNEKINLISESLKIKLDPRDKEYIKLTWENITQQYTSQLSALYDFAKEQGNTNGFYGSDIWRFFSDKVYDYCIETDPEYRNILVILTDGYLYHKETQTQEKNRTTYLTGPYLEKAGLRNNPEWQKKFEEEDFGFIARRNDLNKLEILVLEINPSQVHRNDDEIIKKYWSKWFTEMGVNRYKILTTDLPSNTKDLIKIFLDKSDVL